MELFDINEYDLHGRLNQFLSSAGEMPEVEEDGFDEIDDILDDLDFSDFDGDDFKGNFAKVKSRIGKVIVPQNRTVIVEGKRKPQLVSKRVKPARAKSSLKSDSSINEKPQRDFQGIPVQEGE